MSAPVSPFAPVQEDPTARSARIRRNVDRLVQQGAPRTDIDHYLQTVEGLQPKQTASTGTATGNIDLRTQRESTAVAPTQGSPSLRTSRTGTTISGAAKGLTFGFGDEILGGIGAANSVLPRVLGGEGAPLSAVGANYRRDRDKVRGYDQQSATEHPWLHGAAEFAGSVPSVFATGGAGALARDATVGARLASVAGQAAKYGALQGAGTAKEFRDIPGDAAQSALVSAVAAPLLDVGLRAGGALVSPLISRGATSLADHLPSGRLGEFFKAIGASTGQGGAANAEIGQRLNNDQQTPEGLAASIVRNTSASGQKPEILADYSPEARELTKAVTKAPGPGRAAIQRVINDRNAGTRGRVTADLQAFGRQPAGNPELETLIRARDESASQLFPAAYASGRAVDDPAITELLSRPTFRRVYGMAQTMAADEGRQLPTRTEHRLSSVAQALVDAAQPQDRAALTAKLMKNPAVMETTTIPVPDVRTMAYVDRALRRTIDLGYDGKSPIVDPGHARALQGAFQEMRDRMVAQYPEYGAALQDFSQRSDHIDALQTGLKLFRYASPKSEGVPSQALGAGDPNALAMARKGITGLEAAVTSMSPDEVLLFRRGAHQALLNEINQVPTALTGSTNKVLSTVFSNTPESARWQRLLFDTPEQFAQFRDALVRERGMARTSAAMGGSDTKANLSEENALTKAGGLLGFLAHPKQALNRAAGAATAAQRDQLYGALGERLAASGPPALSDVLANVARAQRGQQAIGQGGSLLRNALIPQLPFVSQEP